MGADEVTTDIPEHTTLGQWWDKRARGLGATRSRPVSTGAEENVLCYSDDLYSWAIFKIMQCQIKSCFLSMGEMN